MFCTKCGKQIESGNLCRECAYEAQRISQSTVAQPIYTTNNTQNPTAQFSNQQFNGQVNQVPIHNSTPQYSAPFVQTMYNTMPYQPVKKKNNTAVILAIVIPVAIIMLVLSIGIASFFLFGSIGPSDPIVGDWRSDELTMNVYSNGEFEMYIPENNSRIMGTWEHGDEIEYVFTGTGLYYDGELIVGGFAVIGIEFMDGSTDVIKIALQMQAGNEESDVITGVFYRD